MTTGNDALETINGCWIGFILAEKLGLNSRFFSRLTKDKPISLNKEIFIWSSGGLVLVRIPTEVSRLLRDSSYIATKIDDNDKTIYDHVFKITAGTKIGFWK